MCNSYSVVMMCTPDTIKGLKNNLKYIKEYLNPNSIVIVANKKVKNIINKENWDIQFIDEDKLYPNMSLQLIKETISLKSDDLSAVKRAGWYFQQFLKMAYCTVCDDEAYLIWDSDTVPTHFVEFYSKSGKKIFDIKTEYNEIYFDTMNRLFPMLKKKNNYSFISEHMLIDKRIMLELITSIEQNNNIEGNTFWKKIINAIEVEHLRGSGFSEFETFGTYVEYFHKDKYEIRKWESLREGTIFYGQGINESTLGYLSQKYDAISFEQHDMHIKLQKLFSHRVFQNLFMINIFQLIKRFLKWTLFQVSKICNSKSRLS